MANLDAALQVFVSHDLWKKMLCGLLTLTRPNTNTPAQFHINYVTALTGWKNVKLCEVGVISGKSGRVTELPLSSTDS